MKRDPSLDRRILLAIEAKRSRAPGPINVDGADPQDVLDHLASMHEEGLYSGLKPRTSSDSGEVILAPVGDLTPAGRRRLEELTDEHQRSLNEVMRDLAVTLGPEPPEQTSVGLQGVQARGVAGEIRGSISNEMPPGGVVNAGEETRSNRPSSRVIVLLQVDALLLVVQSEIGRLRERRQNDDPELRELEELEERAINLRDTTVGVVNGQVSIENAVQVEKSFGSYVRSWFEKHHEQILTGGL